ncbi:PQQ-binding-like beta-propeller repeat protein [Treponema sp. TIM-1]|uniref:outer membrane protein assembly factor BamB family protein n=1 Tax=Treponema sp. TIM-1 TaxID=2898417 RepID=UPI0039816427
MCRRYRCLVFLLAAALPLVYAQETAEGDPPSYTTPIWREALEGMVMGLPSVQAGTVVVVLDGGNLKTYTYGGDFLWDYFAGGKLAPYVTRSREGISYICGTDGIFIVINRVGRELWRLNLGAPLSAPVLVGWDGRLFIPFGERLICYTASGYPLWRKKLPAPIALAPKADNRGGLMMVLENGEFLSINPFGKTRFQLLPEVPAVITPLNSGKDSEDRGTTLVFYQTGTVDRISREPNGTQTLTSAVFPDLPAPPLAAVSRNNLVALTLKDGRVLLLSGSDGRLLWTGESHLRAGKTKDAGEEVLMLFDERGIYVLSRSGASGFTEDGRRLWILDLAGTAALPAFSDEGILFAGGEDWILYAYRTEHRTRSLPRSLYGPAPEGSYGLGKPPLLSWADYTFRFGDGDIDHRLERIREDIFAGRLGENEADYTGYLMELAGSFIHTPGVSAARPPVHVRHRIEGIRLLGYIGSWETIPFLSILLYYEQEPLVKTAAAEAIGRIGLDPDGIALEMFSAMLRPNTPGEDERILTAIAAATGALCRFSGPPLSNGGVKILTTLTGSGYPPKVRDQAKKELRSLSR